jgi:hypothetical protein
MDRDAGSAGAGGFLLLLGLAMLFPAPQLSAGETHFYYECTLHRVLSSGGDVGPSAQEGQDVVARGGCRHAKLPFSC